MKCVEAYQKTALPLFYLMELLLGSVPGVTGVLRECYGLRVTGAEDA